LAVDSNDSAESNLPVLLRSLVTHDVSDPAMTLITRIKMSARISVAPVSSSALFIRRRRTDDETGAAFKQVTQCSSGPVMGSSP
jgi:hypothetical protein